MSEQAAGDGLNLTDATAQLADRWNNRAPEEPDAGVEPAQVERADAQAERDDPPQSDVDELRDALLAAEQSDEVADEPDDDGPTNEQGAAEALERLDFDTVAADYGIDKNALMQLLKHPVRVGDDEREVGMHELVMGYQRGREHEAATAELNRRREAFDADVQARTQKLEAAETQVVVALQMAERHHALEVEAINAQYDNVDWQSLRTTNPAEFAARRTEYELALRGAADRRQQTETAIGSTVRELEAQRDAQRMEAIKIGRAEMPKLIPTWSDPNVAQAEGEELSQYLQAEFGASAEDIESILDPRALRLAYDSWQLSKLRGAAAEARKTKQGGTTKPATPGRSASPQFRRRRAQARRVNEADARLKQSGRQEDATRALSQRWSGRT